MKKFDRLLKGHKNLVFLDFEGTQYSHEMIALGAVLVVIDPKTGKIKREKQSLKVYVRSKNKIGKYVTDLTGITENDLETKGVSFATALNDLKKYCGMAFKKCSFITFGNHDMRILNQSISYNLDAPKEITSQIQKNYVDFSAFISEFVRDARGNPLSLVHYCQLFNVEEAGQAHDPAIDAINLAHLYNAFIQNPALVLNEYKQYLQKTNSKFPEPIAAVIRKLANNESVTPKEFDELLKEYLA